MSTPPPGVDFVAPAPPDAAGADVDADTGVVRPVVRHLKGRDVVLSASKMGSRLPDGSKVGAQMALILTLSETETVVIEGSTERLRKLCEFALARLLAATGGRATTAAQRARARRKNVSSEDEDPGGPAHRES